MLPTNRLPPTGGKKRPTRTNHFVLPTLSFRATDFFAAPTDFSLSPYGVTVETPASPPATIPTQTPNQKQTHFRLVNPRIFLLMIFSFRVDQLTNQPTNQQTKNGWKGGAAAITAPLTAFPTCGSPARISLSPVANHPTAEPVDVSNFPLVLFNFHAPSTRSNLNRTSLTLVYTQSVEL